MNLITNLYLGTVTDKFSGGTTHANDVLEGVDELFLCFHTKHVRYERGGPNKYLSNLGSIVNGRGVRVNGISG